MDPIDAIRLSRRKWLRLVGAAAASSAVAPLVAACAPSAPAPAVPKELIIGQLNEPQSLDVIQRSGDTGASEAIYQIYNELLHFDVKSSKIVPELVERRFRA